MDYVCHKLCGNGQIQNFIKLFDPIEDEIDFEQIVIIDCLYKTVLQAIA